MTTMPVARTEATLVPNRNSAPNDSSHAPDSAVSPTTVSGGTSEMAIATPGNVPEMSRRTSEGRDFYDGGLVSNVPVLEALAMGAKSLVVLDCQFPDQPLDFSKAAPLIDAAYRTARPFLEQVCIDGPGLHRAHVT